MKSFFHLKIKFCQLLHYSSSPLTIKLCMKFPKTLVLNLTCVSSQWRLAMKFQKNPFRLPVYLVKFSKYRKYENSRQRPRCLRLLPMFPMKFPIAAFGPTWCMAQVTSMQNNTKIVDVGSRSPATTIPHAFEHSKYF